MTTRSTRFLAVTRGVRVAIAGLLALTGSAGWACAEPDDPRGAEREYWRGQLAEAYAMQVAGQEGFGDRIRMVAARLAGLDLVEEAIEATDRLLVSPEKPFDSADAWRMKGQYLWARGDTVAAGTAFSNQLAVFDAHPALLSPHATVYASGVNQLACVLGISGFGGAGALVLNRIVGFPDIFAAETIQTAFLNRIAIARGMNDCSAVAVAVDQLFAAFPRYGASTGEFIPLRLATAVCASQSEPPAARLAAVLAVFDDPNAATFPQRLDVGSTAIEIALSANDRASAFKAGMVMLSSIDRYSSDWIGSLTPGVEPVTKESLASLERTLLSLLQSGEDFGSPNASLVAYSRLINFAKTPAEAVYYRSQYQQLVQRLQGP